MQLTYRGVPYERQELIKLVVTKTAPVEQDCLKTKFHDRIKRGLRQCEEAFPALDPIGLTE